MNTLAFLDRRRLRQALMLALLAGAWCCMFPPEHPIFRSWAAQARVVALAYLGLGLVLLVCGRVRLMFVCFGCCAAISFYFHESDLRTEAPARPVGAVAPIFLPTEKNAAYELAPPGG